VRVIDLSGLFGLLDRGGTLAVLVVIIYGGMRRWYVWGWHYDEMRRERDAWRQRALRAGRLGEQSTEVAARVLENPPDPLPLD